MTIAQVCFRNTDNLEIGKKNGKIKNNWKKKLWLNIEVLEVFLNENIWQNIYPSYDFFSRSIYEVKNIPLGL